MGPGKVNWKGLTILDAIKNIPWFMGRGQNTDIK